MNPRLTSLALKIKFSAASYQKRTLVLSKMNRRQFVLRFAKSAVRLLGQIKAFIKRESESTQTRTNSRNGYCSLSFKTPFQRSPGKVLKEFAGQEQSRRPSKERKYFKYRIDLYDDIIMYFCLDQRDLLS